jgi:hypothetical protein
MSLPPPPSRELLPVSTKGSQPYAEMPRAWIKWLDELRNYVSPQDGILWSAISKAGSNLTDLITRKHTDLQDLNTTNYSHLTALQATELTNGGLTSLHTHDTSDMASAIHAASNKTTPVGADEFGIWDSVSGLLNKISFTNALNWFAALAGSASQVFSVALGTSAAHAARVDQISLMPTVTSAASPDIFGAAGATIVIDNSTPVTMTSIANCTAAQVGSTKKLRPSANWTVTASASLKIDGLTSGNISFTSNANMEVMATTTSTFEIKTISDYGTFTTTPTNLTVVGTPTYAMQWSRIGIQVTVNFTVTATTSTASTLNSTSFTLPFTVGPISAVSSSSDNYIVDYGHGEAYANNAVIYTPTWSAGAAHVVTTSVTFLL